MENDQFSQSLRRFWIVTLRFYWPTFFIILLSKWCSAASAMQKDSSFFSFTSLYIYKYPYKWSIWDSSQWQYLHCIVYNVRHVNECPKVGTPAHISSHINCANDFAQIVWPIFFGVACIVSVCLVATNGATSTT